MLLEQIDLLAGLPPDTLEQLRQSARARTFKTGAVVVNQGDDGASGLFLVQSGRLKASIMDEQGREVTLSILGPGDYFGELSLIDDEPRSASVSALEPTELQQISRAMFNELLERHPACQRVVMRNLAGKVRSLSESVRTMALVDVFGRMVKLFTSMAVERDGVRVVEQRLTQQDIANLVGASREMVNRILRDLVTGGYIAVEHQQIQLLKKLPARW